MIPQVRTFYKGMKIFTVDLFKLSPKEKRRKLINQPQIKSLLNEAFRAGRYSIIDFPTLIEELLR